MSLPEIVSRKEWEEARSALLVKEKELTRRRDALNTDRRHLPMVEIEKRYVLEGPRGPVRLIHLFEGRRQLIVYHFMFDPSWESGCPSCTAGVDELSPGFLDHLHTRDTTYAMVSRAPLAKLEAYKAERGWDVPWYSSFGTDFNADFGVTIDPTAPDAAYNYRTKAEFQARGEQFMDGDEVFEMPGLSCFVRVEQRVFHTYSQYARGLVDRRFVLLPRPHRARSPGGLGGAEGPQRRRAGRHARLLVVSAVGVEPRWAHIGHIRWGEPGGISAATR